MKAFSALNIKGVLNKISQKQEKRIGMDKQMIAQFKDFQFSLDDIFKHIKVTGLWSTIISELVEKAVIQREAENMNITYKEDELQHYFNDLRKQLNLIRVEETEQWLSRNSLELIELQNEAEFRLLREKVKKTLAPAEIIERFFQENRIQFDTISVGRLVLSQEGVAYELLAQIQEKEVDFETAVAKYSEDIATKDRGGYVGWLRRGELNSEIESKLFGATAKEIVGPFKTKNGWEIYQVYEMKNAELNPSIIHEIREALYRQWLSKMVK